MPASRNLRDNPNHHLWQHGKAWWVYCAINPTHCTKDKLRRSLRTEDVEIARFRRDQLFQHLAHEGLLRRMHGLEFLRVAGPRLPASAPQLPWQTRVDGILHLICTLTSVPELAAP